MTSFETGFDVLLALSSFNLDRAFYSHVCQYARICVSGCSKKPFRTRILGILTVMTVRTCQINGCTNPAKPEYQNGRTCGWHRHDNILTHNSVGVRPPSLKDMAPPPTVWSEKASDIGYAIDDAEDTVMYLRRDLGEHNKRKPPSFQPQRDAFDEKRKATANASRNLLRLIEGNAAQVYTQNGVPERDARRYAKWLVDDLADTKWKPNPSVMDFGDLLKPKTIENLELKVRRDHRKETKAAKEAFDVGVFAPEYEAYVKTYAELLESRNEFEEAKEPWSEWTKEKNELESLQTKWEHDLAKMETERADAMARHAAKVPEGTTDIVIHWSNAAEIQEGLRKLPNGKYNAWLQTVDENGQPRYVQADKVTETTHLGEKVRVLSGDGINFMSSTHHGGNHVGASQSHTPTILVDRSINNYGKPAERITWHVETDSTD